ncbi:tyrosine-type recombinase/integrase [Rhizobium sp. ZPR3]|uniref:Tyrosine-type recombinase/integrase n=2 Tax=unclassified Rhizobium TaxID=2613769 RepID=A0AAU7SAY6_9HYPH
MSNKSRRYLDLRGLKYWFKRDIPQAIRIHFDGKSAYLKNLETGDIRLAMARRDQIERETDKLFRDARDGRLRLGNVDVIKEIAEAWISEIGESAKDPVAWTAKITNRDKASLSDEEAHDPMTLLEDAAEQIGQDHGDVARRRFISIVHGKVEVDHHIEAYLKEAKLAPKTTDERRNLVKRFAQWAKNEDMLLAKVDRAVAGRYVSAVIAPLHKSTAKKHLGSVKLYWDWLIMRGHYSSKNPWDGQVMPSRGRRVERGSDVTERPFTTEEMQTLLHAPFPNSINPAFKQQLHDAMRISALSGMRLAEVVTLWVDECPLDEKGKGHFDIQQGKTAAAARKVPIHPDLIEIVCRRKKDKAGNDWLFHELAKERNAGDVFSKRFAAYRKKLKVEDNRPGQRRSLVNFHSFRRWFVTEAEQTGAPESIISDVVGHEEGRKSITLRVYSGGPSDTQKRSCVEAVKLPTPRLKTESLAQA